MSKPGGPKPQNRRTARRLGAKRRLTQLMVRAWAVGHAAMVPGVQMREPGA